MTIILSFTLPMEDIVCVTKLRNRSLNSQDSADRMIHISERMRSFDYDLTLLRDGVVMLSAFVPGGAKQTTIVLNCHFCVISPSYVSYRTNAKRAFTEPTSCH